MSDFDFPALKEAQGKLDAARKALADVMREGKDGDRYDMDKIKSVSGDKNAKLEWIRAKNAELPELKKEVEKYRVIADAARTSEDYDRDNPGTKGSDEGPETKDRKQGGDIGRLFVKSKAFTEKGQTAHLDVSLKETFMIDSVADTGWPPESIRSGRVELTPQRPERNVAFHIPSGTINQPLYKYMEETVFDTEDASNLAGFTAEGAAFTEASLELEEKSQPVEKLTVWIPMTDEQLEDVDAAESYVRQRLTYMMNARLDANLLVGSGSSHQLLGTENVSGIQSQALGADTTLDAIYKLFTLIRTDGFAEPNVGFMNPSKWQAVQLLKTADGQYIWGHPSGTGPLTVWGVPVVLTTAHTSTKFVAGDYSGYAQLFHKRGIDVQVTNAHSDFFIKGKQALRMDARMVMVHFRPKAFGVVTGL